MTPPRKLLSSAQAITILRCDQRLRYLEGQHLCHHQTHPGLAFSPMTASRVFLLRRRRQRPMVSHYNSSRSCWKSKGRNNWVYSLAIPRQVPGTSWVTDDPYHKSVPCYRPVPPLATSAAHLSHLASTNHSQGLGGRPALSHGRQHRTRMICLRRSAPTRL